MLSGRSDPQVALVEEERNAMFLWSDGILVSLVNELDATHAYLVANARFHDTDYARLRLLELLAEDEDVRTRVADSFADTAAIAEADFLITYTCDLRPTEDRRCR